MIPAFAYGPKILTHGWEVNSILKFQNGQPVNVLTGQDNSGTAEGEDRASITGPALNGDRSVQQHSYAQYLNPSSFAVPTPGTYGNLARNQVVGPGFGDVDLSLIKNTPIYKERVRAQFRVEMFNVFNRVNLAQPLNNMGYGPRFWLEHLHHRRLLRRARHRLRRTVQHPARPEDYFLERFREN